MTSFKTETLKPATKQAKRADTSVCRLAAWLGPEIRLEDLILKPPHSLIEQSQAATESKLAVNGDGYGFAWYAKDGRLGVYRDVLPAWGDSNLSSLATMITSQLVLAHVRASTYGQVSRSNCHPFTSSNWSFMHNGQIANFGCYRRTLETRLSDQLYAQRTGNTDSECLFMLLLEHGLEQNVHKAVDSVLQLLSSVTEQCRQPTRVSAVFSDGDQLFALRVSSDRKSPTLYVKRSNSGGVVLASEPLDKAANDWCAVEEGSLLTVNRHTQSSYSVSL